MRTSTDELQPDDPFYAVVGNTIQGSYIPATSSGSASGSTSGSVMSVTSGGITINLVLDAAAQAAPASFKNGLQQAVSILAANITDKITVNIKIDYSGTGGGAAAGPDSGYYENYSWVRSELVNNATAGDTTFNSLPTGSTIQGQTNVAVWNAQLKLWGVIGANDATTDDASANFATDINPNLLVGVALHELTHAMARVPYGSAPDVFDLFRFTSPGVRLFQGGATAPAAYFSVDGGNTKLADYGQNSDPSDFLNSGVQGANDPFNEYYTSTTIQGLTTVDLKQLDALGFHLAAYSPTTIESVGTTSLVLAGSNYFLNPTSGGGGPSLKYGGTSVTVGQFAPLSPIAAEQVGSGYDVAWKSSSADQYTVWSVNNNGDYVASLASAVAGASYALESLETSFHQDLNGDGTIGLVTRVIESAGSTNLTQVADNYFANPTAGGTGPTLKYGGATITAGQWGGWAPIGAEASGGGYEVAWKLAGTDQYTVWNTDANGNDTINNIGIVANASYALESLETSFHQDLNGDGTIGLVTSVIESAGSTSLTEVADNYFANPTAGGTGPTLKYGGVAITVGQWGGWAPIGTEASGGGYEVAWKLAGADQYTVWNTDANGNDTSNSIGTVSGSSNALESLETSFHQDLNGDGAIGVVASVIESAGSTNLTQVSNNYFANPTAGGTGPTLKYGGVAITVGQWGGWAPIGAEAAGGGYEVAWKLAGADQYTVWNTDANGNDTINSIGTVSGSSTALESLETSFHQDLNGDGTIGLVASVIESAGSTSLAQVGSNYFANPTAGGTGPTLKYGGAAITVGQWGNWAPIGAEAAGGGYEVAWKLAGADQYTVWNTDANGNDTINSIGTVSGSSNALESLETSFHQDLNGDGIIGVPSPTPPQVVTVANDSFTFGPSASIPSNATISAVVPLLAGNAVAHVDTFAAAAAGEPATDVLADWLAHHQDSFAGFVLPHG